MDVPSDTYLTLAASTNEFLFKEKKSKFFAIAYPIQTEAEVKPLVESLRKKYHTANHVCYAWQLGVEQHRYRANDDGEPNNSAGMPIYGQILAFDLKNVLVAVIRIFGGTRLGVGGLISAYREAARLALENGIIIECTVKQHISVLFEYPQMDIVMRTIKQQQLEIVSQRLELDCELLIAVPKSRTGVINELFSAMNNVRTKELDL